MVTLSRGRNGFPSPLMSCAFHRFWFFHRRRSSKLGIIVFYFEGLRVVLVEGLKAMFKENEHYIFCLSKDLFKDQLLSKHLSRSLERSYEREQDPMLVFLEHCLQHLHEHHHIPQNKRQQHHFAWSTAAKKAESMNNSGEGNHYGGVMKRPWGWLAAEIRDPTKYE